MGYARQQARKKAFNASTKWPYSDESLLALKRRANEVLALKAKPIQKWVKPEHPIALRRRLKKEREERLQKRLPVAG